VTEAEVRRLAESGAVAGLCPTTEANLGDGVFPAVAYLEAGGAFGIGSDSHISVSPIEELRWLEYGQRLTARRRNLLARSGGGQHGTPPGMSSVGARLFGDALAGGAQALGRPIGRLAPGARADLLVIDPERPNLTGRLGDVFLDALVFAGNDNPVTGVMVGGDWLVRDGHHAREAEILTAYKSVIADLTA
jgi:formimidoylglutamate deiminase